MAKKLKRGGNGWTGDERWGESAESLIVENLPPGGRGGKDPQVEKRLRERRSREAREKREQT